MHKAVCDITVLRSHFVPPWRILFKNKGDGYVEGTQCPVGWLRDFEYLAKIHGATFKFVDNLSNKGNGLYSPKSNGKGSIALRQTKEITPRKLLQCFFHELAHHLQNVVSCRLTGRCVHIYTFKAHLKFERTAERTAYFLWKRYIGRRMKAHHAEFSTYRSKHDKDFLKRYHTFLLGKRKKMT